MQTAKRKRYQKDCAPADDIITLIHLVRENPALYNYKLQPNQRRRADVLSGWAQIAVQIGNKYTVEECRRKWKNLRDTYHQYRLRKPKLGDGLAKWRYAKELEFLSNVYQPKLKSQRNQSFDSSTAYLLHDVEDDGEVTTHHEIKHSSKHRHHQQHNHHHHHHNQHHSDHNSHHHNHHDHHSDNGMDGHHPSSITLVHGDTESFILTAYEDVNDDIDHDGGHMELHSVEDVTGEIVKSEHGHQLDDDDGVAAEVDYEEVCLYEEAGNAPSADCETIITGAGGATVVSTGGVGVGNDVNGGGGGGTGSSPSDTKEFQYIDNDFCIESTINGHEDLQSPNATVVNAGGPGSIITTNGPGGLTKLKNVSVVTTNTNVVDAATGQPTTVTVFTTTAPSMLDGSGSLKIHNMVGSPSTALVQHDPSGGGNTSLTDGSLTVGGGGATTLLTVPASANNNGLSVGQPTNVFTTCTQAREELDLFFDFLKKKMQNFPREEITSIQVEFLNCVLRREAEQAQKACKNKY